VSGSAPDSSGRHTLKKVMPTIAASTSGATGRASARGRTAGACRAR
jgi:hypothetical protein